MRLPEGFPPLQAVYWENLQSGMIYAGGFSINGLVPPELKNFPVLSRELIDALHQRYHLLPGNRVLILSPNGVSGSSWIKGHFNRRGESLDPEPKRDYLSPREVSDLLVSSERRITRVNDFRRNIRKQMHEMGTLDAPVDSILASALVDQAESFSLFGVPQFSLLRQIEVDIGISDLLSGSIVSKFAFPKDTPFQLHILVDFSYSMKASGKDDTMFTAANFLHQNLSAILPQAIIRTWGFSDSCRELMPPLSGRELPRKETHLDTAVKKVLGQGIPGMKQKVILLSDGLPTDTAAALRLLERLRESGTSWTQVIFRLDNDQRIFSTTSKGLDGYAHPDEKDDTEDLFTMGDDEYGVHLKGLKDGFAELAKTAGGDQFILTLDRALGLVAVEVFDRWLGNICMN